MLRFGKKINFGKIWDLNVDNIIILKLVETRSIWLDI